MATSKRTSSNGRSRASVVATPGICGGNWRIHGTRITIKLLARSRALGASNEELLEDYPSLTEQDLAAAWAFTKKHPEVVKG